MHTFNFMLFRQVTTAVTKLYVWNLAAMKLLFLAQANAVAEVGDVENVSMLSDLQNFLIMVENLRSSFNHVDQLANPGHVIGQMVSENQWTNQHEGKLSVEISFGLFESERDNS